MATAAATARRLLTGSRSLRLNGILPSSRTVNATSASVPLQLFDYSKRWMTSEYPAHEVVGMPSLSPTMEAGTIASWNLSEGESFGAGDVLCEVETDKATVSFEAQDEGVVAKILADAGPDEIQCGEPILITVEDEDDVDAFKDYVAEAVAAAPSPAAASPVAPPTSAVAPPPVSPPPAAAPAPTHTPTSTGGRTVASPLAWTIAKERGMDLASIAIVGTGPGGRIIADDVREFIPSAAPTASAETATSAPPAAAAAPLPPPVEHGDYTDYPLSPESIETANLLTHSKQTVPHYYLTVDVTLDALIALRSRLNTQLPEEQQLTLNDLLLKASASAMKSCPSANASWLGDAVRQYNSVDINFVMGSGETMYAPLIKSADSRGIKSLSEELASNLAKVEEGDIGGDEFASVGTVTVMNLGMYGIKSCAPIIREPQAVALALGAAENRIVPKAAEDIDEEDGEIYDVNVMLTATLSCDHRVVDGAVGAQWLSAFKAAVENPETLLL